MNSPRKFSSGIPFVAPCLPSRIAGGFNSRLLFRLTRPLVFQPFYHTVSDVYLPHIHPLYQPKKIKDFERDLEFLLRHFSAASIREANFYIQNPAELKKHVFHLSFDDGLRGVYEHLTPLLYRKGIPATIFVNSAFVDNKQLFYRHKAAILIDILNKEKPKKEADIQKIYAVPYADRHFLDEMAVALGVDFQAFLKTERPYLTGDEIKDMQTKGFTVGAHSIDHPDFRELDAAEQIRQITESCAFVKETFGEQNAWFSFPFSDENMPETLFKAIENTVDMSFGITGIHIGCNGRHAGRTDMEKNGENARGTVNKAFLKATIYSFRLQRNKQPACREANGLKIERLKYEQIDLQAYNRCIESTPFGTVYAMSWYLDAVSPCWELLMAENYRYVMPLPVKRKFGMKYLMQPLFCQQLGVFSTCRLTAETLESFIAAIPYSFYHLQLNSGNMFCPVALKTRNNFELDLSLPYQEIRKKYRKNFSRNIQKAVKANLHAIKEIDLETFWNVLANNCDGRPIKRQLSARREIIRRIKQQTVTVIWSISDDSGILSAALFFYWKDRVYYMLPVSTTEGKAKQSMSFLLDSLIQMYAGKKLTLDFEGSSLPNIARFYQSAGAGNACFPVITNPALFNVRSFIKRLFR
jgi:peptidoglycan/xylan/chitin deacetylase (PgdA/CDA1 family)